MLLGGNSGSCGGCGCKSCQECTRTCTEPHTGDPFEVHYTLFFEGVEAGNPGNGIATGDVDTSDPYDGMDGTGPWEQTVLYTFDITPGASDRYPCKIRLSFWRSNFVLGPATNPPPSQDLTVNKITVANISPQSAGNVRVGPVTIPPGETYELSGAVPLVVGAGDQSTNDPRSGIGTVSFEPECGNERIYVTVTATIEWNIQKRQHVLYGLVRECYEENDIGAECAAVCAAPSSVPNEVYLTLSNFNITGVSQDTNFDGAYYTAEEMQNLLSEYLGNTFVVPRILRLCNSFETFGSAFVTPCVPPYSFVEVMPNTSPSFMGGGPMIGVYFDVPGKGSGTCLNDGIALWIPDFEPDFICGTSYSKSGTATFSTASKTVYGDTPGVSHIQNTRSSSYAGSFNWLVES